MKNFEQTVTDVERDLLINLLLALKWGKLTKADAKKVAREFVSQSYQNPEELFAKLYSLSKSNKEARKALVKYAPEYHRELDKQALNRLRGDNQLVSKGGE